MKICIRILTRVFSNIPPRILPYTTKQRQGWIYDRATDPMLKMSKTQLDKLRKDLREDTRRMHVLLYGSLTGSLGLIACLILYFAAINAK